MKNKKNTWSSNRLRNFQIGILVALSTVFMAFEWSSTSPTYPDDSKRVEATDEIPIIRTVHTPKKKKVPPPLVVTPKLDVIEPAVEYSNEPIIKESKEDQPIAAIVKDAPPTPDPPKAAVVAPIVEPDIKEVEETIHYRVEHMPLFTSECSDLPTKEDRDVCSENAMLKFVYKHIKYPTMAKENGIEGIVIIQFVIETDGSASNINIVRDIGGGCGREVERLVRLMPNWIPGRQGIHKVRVKYSLPVKFDLQ